MKKEKTIILIKKICNKTYFTYSELCCKCELCKENSSLKSAYKGKYKESECNLNPEFLKKLLLFRIIYDTPFTPKSVYRCPNHPDYSSNHAGFAIDVPYQKGSSVQRFKLIQSALKAGFKRIGISVDFIHLDCNPKYNGTLLEEVLWIYKNKFLN